MGAEAREKTGREVFGRQENRGRKEGFSRWRKAGEIGENYATLCKISQSKKKHKEARANKNKAGTGI